MKIGYRVLLAASLIALLGGCAQSASRTAGSEPTAAVTESPSPTPTPVPAPKLDPALADAFHPNISGLKPLDALQRQGIVPVRLRIPAIHLDTAVEPVGLLDNGQMDVPKSFETTGWLESGPKPGEAGNAVIDGHLDQVKGPAVFWLLKTLKPGDEVIVYDEHEQKRTFVVKNVQAYKTEEAPLSDIFGFSMEPHLNLITCAGVYNHDTHSSDKRLVVYTDLKEE